MKQVNTQKKHPYSFSKKTGGLKLSSIVTPKNLFIFSGLATTIWFLIRVIPKPGRASYPCMRAAAPVMSAFVIYLLGISSSFLLFKNAKKMFARSRYIFAGILGFFAFGMAIISFTGNSKPILAEDSITLTPNSPVGTARGIFPGRVAWVWEPEATNEKCTNAFGDAWDLSHNTSSTLVDAMFTAGLLNLFETENTSDAWVLLFEDFNEKQGKGAVSYQPGEKIFIKMNFVGGHRTRLNSDHSRKDQTRYGNSQSSPQVALALLRQLINVCGVAQEDIFIGDPSKNIYKSNYDMWKSEFPGINCVAEFGEMGRMEALQGEQPAIFYSDKKTVLGVSEDYLCSAIENADYLINIGALKGHARAGITVNTKNHFGSHMADDASHLHPGLPGHDETTAGYKKYRVLVDLMGHKKLGGNTLLYIVDGLYAGPDANLKPDKWKMAPFNDDWTSSVFLSQDPVAIESVCFDFLRTEYTADNSPFPYPQMYGVDDYLLQAADSAFWPDNIIYDPENDGECIGSLGVYEHWNDPLNRKYSVNLGTGNGIELKEVFNVKSIYLPAAPSELVPEILSSSSIRLSWTDNSDNEQKFIVEMSERTAGNFRIIDTLDENTTEYICENLKSSNLYFFRVRAVGEYYSSDYSNNASAYTSVTGLNRTAAEDATLTIFPNPVRESLAVQVASEYSGKVQIVIIDAGGKIISRSEVNKDSYRETFDMKLENVNAGMYILRVQFGQEIINHNILIVSM